MIKVFKNPFFLYVISFLLVFIIYSLGWSNMYPKLSLTLIVFFISTFIIAILLGLLVDKTKAIEYNRLILKSYNKPILFLVLIWIGHSIQFLYFDEIPFFSLINKEKGVDYRDFGIKTFHVILVSFNSFVSVYLFHICLSKKNKFTFFLYLLSLIPSILIVNRGMFMIAVMSSFLVFLISKKTFLTFKQTLITSIVLLIVLYFFGVIGNIRSGHGDPNYIPKESAVTKSFLNSSIPKEYYWTYLYGASPLANFQYNINKTKNVDYNLFDLVLFETIPEVVSNRVALLLNRDRLDSIKIREWLTVGTVYSKSYCYAKWIGPIVIFIYTMFLLLITMFLVPKKSSYHVTVIAILSTLVFMNTFSNMLTFSGMILQLFFPIFFRLFENKKFVIR